VTLVIDEEMQKDLEEIEILMGKPMTKLELFTLMTKQTLHDLKSKQTKSKRIKEKQESRGRENNAFGIGKKQEVKNAFEQKTTAKTEHWTVVYAGQEARSKLEQLTIAKAWQETKSSADQKSGLETSKLLDTKQRAILGALRNHCEVVLSRSRCMFIGSAVGIFRQIFEGKLSSETKIDVNSSIQFSTGSVRLDIICRWNISFRFRWADRLLLRTCNCFVPITIGCGRFNGLGEGKCRPFYHHSKKAVESE
jgi:hypothetical protein